MGTYANVLKELPRISYTEPPEKHLVSLFHVFLKQLISAALMLRNLSIEPCKPTKNTRLFSQLIGCDVRAPLFCCSGLQLWFDHSEESWRKITGGLWACLQRIQSMLSRVLKRQQPPVPNGLIFLLLVIPRYYYLHIWPTEQIIPGRVIVFQEKDFRVCLVFNIIHTTLWRASNFAWR